MQDRRRLPRRPSPEERGYLRRLFGAAGPLAGELLDDEAALQLLEQVAWPTRVACPACGGVDYVELRSGKNARKRRRYCNPCRAQFSPTSATPLANEKASPSVVVLAAGLATQFRGSELSEEIERRAGVRARSAPRLALKVQELFEVAMLNDNGARGSSGRLMRAGRLAAAVLLVCMMGVASVWLARVASEPLYVAWMSGERQFELTTAREPGEDRGAWLERHSRAFAEAITAHPPSSR